MSLRVIGAGIETCITDDIFFPERWSIDADVRSRAATVAAVHRPNTNNTTPAVHTFQRPMNNPIYGERTQPAATAGSVLAQEAPPTYKEAFTIAEPPSYLSVQENGDMSLPPSHPAGPPNAETSMA